jgi:hypothetical protein
MTNPSEFL